MGKDARQTIGGWRVNVEDELKVACELPWHPVKPFRCLRNGTDVDDFDLKNALSDTIAAKIDVCVALLLVSSSGVPGREVLHQEVERFAAAQAAHPLVA